MRRLDEVENRVAVRLFVWPPLDSRRDNFVLSEQLYHGHKTARSQNFLGSGNYVAPEYSHMVALRKAASSFFLAAVSLPLAKLVK